MGEALISLLKCFLPGRRKKAQPWEHANERGERRRAVAFLSSRRATDDDTIRALVRQTADRCISHDDLAVHGKTT